MIDLKDYTPQEIEQLRLELSQPLDHAIFLKLALKEFNNLCRKNKVHAYDIERVENLKKIHESTNSQGPAGDFYITDVRLDPSDGVTYVEDFTVDSQWFIHHNQWGEKEEFKKSQDLNYKYVRLTYFVDLSRYNQEEGIEEVDSEIVFESVWTKEGQLVRSDTDPGNYVNESIGDFLDMERQLWEL